MDKAKKAKVVPIRTKQESARYNAMVEDTFRKIGKVNKAKIRAKAKTPVNMERYETIDKRNNVSYQAEARNKKREIHKMWK